MAAAAPRFVAIVTGASRGIGAAVARLLARTGGAVVITARSPGELAAAIYFSTDD